MSTKSDKSRDQDGAKLTWQWRSVDGRTGVITSGRRSAIGDAVGDDDQLAELTLRLEEADGWVPEITVVPVNDELRIARWSFIATGDGAELADPRSFQRFRYGDLQQRFVSELRWVTTLLGATGLQGVPAVRHEQRPGRRGHDELEYAKWANDYVKAVEEDAARPVALLVDQQPGTTAGGWRRWLARAEELDLLVDRPKSGRAGGRLSTRAKRMLADAGIATERSE